MSIKIRQVTPKDIYDIVRIEQIIEGEHAVTQKTLLNRLAMFPDGFRVADYKKKKIVGYIESCIWNQTPSFSTFSDIRNFSKHHQPNGTILFIIFIGVASNFQKMGIGSSLLSEMKALSKRYEIKKIQLVSKQNYVHSFYQKNDFCIVKQLPHYLPNDPGVLMEYNG